MALLRLILTLAGSLPGAEHPKSIVMLTRNTTMSTIP